MLIKRFAIKTGILALLGVVGHTGTAAALPLPSGCGNELYPLPGEYTLNVDGNTTGGDLDREYEVFVPTGYAIDTPTPLVFLYHPMGPGTPVNGNWIQTNWSGPVAPVVVSPRALSLNELDLEGNPRAWNLNLDWSDVEFIDALKHQMIADFCVDEEQIFAYGGSSGGFGALGTGSHNHMSALVSDRGAILHPPDASQWGFPETPEPADEACGPIPTLLGYAMDDQTIDFPLYGIPTIDFFVANNGCDTSPPQLDEEATAEVCESNTTDPVPGCVCLRYDNCLEELAVCTWDGGHNVSGIGLDDARWFFHRVGANSSRPACRHEPFDSGSSRYQWDISTELNFDAYFHAKKGRLHVDVPKAPYVGFKTFYTPGAYLRFDEHHWDVPLVKDFSVSMTVTNLKYRFPEVRLKLFLDGVFTRGGAAFLKDSLIEIRTAFDASGNLIAQAYNSGNPAGTPWTISRSGPGGTRLWDGACWMVRGDPITDTVSVFSRDIDSNDWPNCSGDWTNRASFFNPYFASVDPDYNSTPLGVLIEVGRNNAALTAKKDSYVRLDDVVIGRGDCGAN